MGHYTELNLQTTLDNTPGSRGRELIENVKLFNDKTGNEPRGAFWNCQRASAITTGMQYMVALITSAPSPSADLSFRVEIKNYDQEIEKFLQLLAPVASEHTDEPVYLGSVLDENDYVPTLAWSVRGQLVLKPANQVAPI